MRYLLLIITVLLLSISGRLPLGNKPVSDVATGQPRVSFGVRIAMDMNSQMTTFIGLRYDANGILRGKKIFRKDEFIKVLAGYWPSPFNPKRINYFVQEKVAGAAWRNDTLNQDVAICPVLDSLWKVRFKLYPFRGTNEEGWSNGQYQPSLKQQKYLVDRYHIGHMDLDFFVDTNFWKLLRDAQDEKWIAGYKAIN